MIKEIEIHGQRVKLYSTDEGHTWTSSPQAPLPSGPIETMQRLELQKRLERIDGRRNWDPNDGAEFDIPRNFNRR